MATWAQLTLYRAGTKLWVNFDLVAQIKPGGGAFAEATQITTPGAPDIYIEEDLEKVAALAAGRLPTG